MCENQREIIRKERREVTDSESFEMVCTEFDREEKSIVERATFRMAVRSILKQSKE